MKAEIQSRELPQRLAEVAARSTDLATFGLALREWEHHVAREGVHSRPALQGCLEEAPPRLNQVFQDGDIADAYLAALAEWLSLKHRLSIPGWVEDDTRIAHRAWWAHQGRELLLAKSPSSFRTRHLFTIPHDPFTSKRGRPRTSEETKREKQRVRQKRYRERIKKLVKRAREENLG